MKPCSCWRYPYWLWSQRVLSVHCTAFFIRGYEKLLNAFYYACSYAKADYSCFMNITAGMALKLIPEKLSSQPVFLCIDDTIVSKFGKKFEDVSKLFDHAAHNGSNYLNGHCFVSIMLCVPVWDKNRIRCLSVPLGYRMWQKRRQSWNLPRPWSAKRCQNWKKAGHCVCNVSGKKFWQQASVFQCNFSRTDTDLLCMAGKIPSEPDSVQLYAVYPFHAVCF